MNRAIIGQKLKFIDSTKVPMQYRVRPNKNSALRNACILIMEEASPRIKEEITSKVNLPQKLISTPKTGIRKIIRINP